MRRRALTLLAGILVLGLMPGPVLAVSVVDQSSEDHHLKVPGHDLAQTVTVGQTGMLTGVDLFLESAAGWTDAVSIQTIERVSRKPTGSKLASATISVSAEKWYHIEFATPVSLIAGGQFAIVLSQGDDCYWHFSSKGYSGGEALEYYDSAWIFLHNDANQDFSFRTYMAAAVNPTAVPIATPTPTPTPTPAATATPVPSASPTASIAATPTVQPNAPSGGSGDSSIVIVLLLVIVALVAVLGGGIGFVLARRR